MNRAQVLDRLDQLVAARSILEHPFYQAWQRGELTQDQLATYARVYYPHVAAFPGHLEDAAARATRAEAREELTRNLADELGNPAPHPELWLDFAEAVGCDRSEVAVGAAHPAASALVATLRGQARGTTAAALAALYAYESQQTEVSRTKMDGLTGHYGVTTAKGLGYFAVHAELDLDHRQGEREMLGRCIDDGATADEILGAAEATLSAYWGLLDGVCAEAGIACAMPAQPAIA